VFSTIVVTVSVAIPVAVSVTIPVAAAEVVAVIVIHTVVIAVIVTGAYEGPASGDPVTAGVVAGRPLVSGARARRDVGYRSATDVNADSDLRLGCGCSQA
jgi:hypothetical protein